MFADNTLTPKEATRLCALGLLCDGPCRYSDMARELRRFMAQIAGPSLELMGTSLELLRFEGLVAALDGKGMEDDACLTITEEGRQELAALLQAPVRASSNDLNMLIVTLKLRFLHLLDEGARAEQIHLLADACELEIGRLEDLADDHAGDAGLLVPWTRHRIKELRSRLAWLQEMLALG